MKILADLLTPQRLEQILSRIQQEGDIIEASENDPKQKRKFWWTQICEHILKEEYQNNKGGTFKKIMGQTHLFTTGELRYIFETSYRWRKNPPALLWKLIREKNKELKKTKLSPQNA